MAHVAEVAEAVEERAPPELVTNRIGSGGHGQCSQPVSEAETVYVLGQNVSGEVSGGRKDYHSEVQVAKRECESVSEKLIEMEKQFNERFDLITADADKSKKEIATLRETVKIKSEELISKSDLLKEKDCRIRQLEAQLKTKDDELKRQLEEKQRLEEQVSKLREDVHDLKSQMDIMKNNLASKKDDIKQQLPEEVRDMMKSAISEFQSLLSKALSDSFVDKMSYKSLKAVTGNGTTPSNNGH